MKAWPKVPLEEVLGRSDESAVIDPAVQCRSRPEATIRKFLIVRQDGYFDALVRMFEQALKAIATLPDVQRSTLWERLDEVRRICHNLGYGVGDDMDDLLAEHGVDD